MRPAELLPLRSHPLVKPRPYAASRPARGFGNRSPAGPAGDLFTSQSRPRARTRARRALQKLQEGAWEAPRRFAVEVLPRACARRGVPNVP
jgi:hypothetical protein